MSHGEQAAREDLLGRVVDRLPAYLAVVDAQTLRYLFVNENYVRNFGRSRESIVGTHIAEVIGRERYEFALPFIEKVRRGETASYVNRFSVADGERIIQVNYVPGLDAEGRVREILVLNHDVTELKRAERALLESTEMLHRTEQISKVGGWTLDAAANRLDWTRETFRIHEVPEDFIPDVGKAIRFYHPEDQPIISSAVERALATGEPFDCELRILTARGKLVWVRAIGEAVGDRGRVTKISGTFQDITERKRAGQDLRESERRLSALFERSPVGIGELDPRDGRFLRVNPRYCEIVGLTREEMLATDFQTLTHPDDLAADLEYMRRLLSGEIREFSMEKRYLKKGGAIVWVKLSVSPLWKPGEAPERHIAIVEDITERRRAEEMVQRAQKMESLGVLAGGIAHDFNNMLAGFFNYVALAQGRATEPKVVEYLAKASDAMDRARGLTRQLLTFAKGGEPVRKIEDLSALIREGAKFALSGSNLSIDFGIAADLWPCRVDRGQIGQVIDNLVINAQQAMPGGGRIAVDARNLALGEGEHPTLPAGPYLRLSIIDGGCGIPREHQARIFDPFFTTKVKGQGLGLATSYSIVQRHGGCIEVASEVGRGSAFHVFLPAEPGGTGARPPEPSVPHRGAGLILVMDDEAAFLDSLSELLRGFGYDSVRASGGEEALDAFEADRMGPRQIVALILDLTIPGGMGGKELIARIRERDGEVPAFVASGYAADPVMARPEAFGFTASLGKPFRPVELERLLKIHLPTAG
ncbi:MAG: PAS domain S-box protein [Spirochaetes bacterium]|nr:PAS domain S-box protein [Spirochaetota bacterium]